jgi:hypothetical protein
VPKRAEVVVGVPNEAEITESGTRLLLEQTLSGDGKWRVHKSDPDDLFPSDFHAHNIDDPEVLDLHTGDVYDSRTKKWLRKLKPKTMRYMFNEIASSKEPELTSKCSTEGERFTFFN